MHTFYLQTANQGVFLVFEVARRPEVQEKLYAEIKSVLGDSRHPTAEHLAAMPYLKGCVMEAFRYVISLYMECCLYLGFNQITEFSCGQIRPHLISSCSLSTESLQTHSHTCRPTYTHIYTNTPPHII